MNKKITIIIACHKACDVPRDPMYFPVQVGSAGKESIPGFARDDQGENISAKNPIYCELTGLYWAWKNLDCEYLGLVHYRRYFTSGKIRKKQDKNPFAAVLSGQEAERLLAQYRLIVPKKRHYYIESVYSHYAHTFDGKQFDLTREILQEKWPAYVPAFDRLMKGSSAWLFNMFLMRKEDADVYCSWVFQVLQELENRVDTKDMTAFEKRYAGRVSERLLNVWLLHRIETGQLEKRDIYECPYTYLGEVNWGKKISGFLKAKFLHKKYKQSF